MLNNPVFIISLHRSGSTLLKNILDSSSMLAMATDEMHISDPFYRTFDNQFRDFKLNREGEIDRLVDLIYSGEIKGSFWRDYSGLGIEKKVLAEAIKESDRSLKGVISAILNEYRKKSGKERVGAKYPLHASRLKMLLKWYPDAKIIFLTRDSRAITASKLHDEATEKRKRCSGIFRFIIHYFTMFFFVLDYIWFSRIVHKNKDSGYTIKYEKMLLRPEEEIRSLCEFLEIPFDPEMLKAGGKPSSHDGDNNYGFNKSRIDKWKNILNRFDRFLVTSLSGKAMKRLGY